MPVYLLLAAAVIFACVLLNKLSSKLGIPMLLAFILLGMFFGSDGVVRIPFDNYAFAEQICSVALIFIMFYGGFGTNWKAAEPIAGRAVLLSTLGVVLTAGITGLFCRLVLRMEWTASFLLASVVASTDAASVFSILRSKRLNLNYNTASLLEVESGSNDPSSYMLTAIMLAVINGTASGIGVVRMIFEQLIYGAVFGFLIAYTVIWLLKRIRFCTAGFDAVFVVAVALLSYAAPAALGGNGYLSAYIVGIVLGNARIRNKKTLVPFFDGMTGLMQMLVFFLLGLLSFPSRLPQVMLPALAIALFLTVVARPAAIFALLAPFRSPIQQRIVVSWTGLRGAASIVFAIMAMSADVGVDIFHIVFCIVLFSILLQGSLIPFVSKKVGMIDEGADVMKTFSDYTDEVPIQFIRATIHEGHPWCAKALRDVTLPPETLIVLLLRDTRRLVPNGKTVFHEGDTIIMSARPSGRIEGVQLSEKSVAKGDALAGKTLAQITALGESLVIMIRRAGKVVIPKGDTVICEDDVLVINHPEES